MLSFYFKMYHKRHYFAEDAFHHRWTIVEALGMNIKRFPELISLKIFGWLDNCEHASLFDKAKIARLAASLRHLSFSLPAGVTGAEVLTSHEQFWKQVVVQNMLKPAVNLESLAIKGVRGEKNSLDISQALLATYPRLAALSLQGIIWEDGTIGRGNIVPPPLEDFIVRHRETLKILKLSGCSIHVEGYGRKPPICYWADVYKRLANALTELVELEVEFDEGKKIPYLSSTNPPNESVLPWSYNRLKRLEGMERDAEALEEFKAVVKKRATITGSHFNPEGKGWSGWDEGRMRRI
jgi:hypothetical protein